MKLIHVAGSSGAGKSAISRRLRQLGHPAISTDGADGLCRWIDDAGADAVRPDEPTARWLATHYWIWDSARLDEIIDEFRSTSVAETLYMCGTADNDGDLADRFDEVVLLDIDAATMVARVLDPSRGNDFGRCGDSLSSLVSRLPSVRPRYLRRGAIIVDATTDLDTVVTALLRATH